MSDAPISRGFFGRRRPDARSDRIPPGQHLVTDFPVLSAGPTPRVDLARWAFALRHNGQDLARWTWAEFNGLDQTDVMVDIHCVTTWSKLDTKWRGVSIDTLLEAAGLSEPPGPFAMMHCDGGYTTNVPLADMTGGKAMLAHTFDGRPLEPAHGGPARLLVPHLYFWKSAKWVRSIEFIDRDQPGFWERSATTCTAIPGGSSAMRAIDEAAAATPPRLLWRTAEVLSITEETARVRTLSLDVPGWPGHLAGQHLDVRLTAADGYSAQRSYSIGSAPETPHVELTVQRLDEGEVSPYLAHDVRPGDFFEVRGPIGGHFVWTVARGGPLFLIAGGSGVVPLMAMLRHRAASGASVPALLLYSSRTFADIIFRDELERLAAPGTGLTVVHTLTDAPPTDWTGYRRRIDRAMIEAVGFGPAEKPRCFVCGPTGLVETAARTLVELGHAAALVKTERFGPTGV